MRPGFLALMFAAVSWAVGPTATLTGRVADLSGGVITDVKVEATDVETNVVFTAETNNEGLYGIPNLPPGTYRVIVSKFAFRTIVKPDVEPQSFPIGEQRRVEFRWEALNALNHPQFTQIPARNVVGTPPGQFLNRDFTDSGIRNMWAQVRLVF
jgi:hypothetical protein